MNPNKATGHDNIAPPVHKICPEQLALIFVLYCFSTNTVLAARKTACIVSVPKRPVISSLNDLRLVALPSAVMKERERVVLCKLDNSMKVKTDPFQFACRRNRSIDDAVLYVLENV